MDVHYINPAQAGIANKILRDYVEGHPDLRSFYTHNPNAESVKEAIAARSTFPIDRAQLTQVFLKQHALYLDRYPSVAENIRALSDEMTFTVTTGHQLCMGTGPLFFIYKLVTCINAAREFSLQSPECTFVPVFWLASEDHDIAEMDHFQIGSSQVRFPFHATGASGRLHTADWNEEWALVESMLGTFAQSKDALQLLKQAYEPGRTISTAIRDLVLQLFGHQGLLVIDADDAALKRCFIPVLREELELGTSAALVAQTSKRLAANYTTQAMVRDLNLFYLSSDSRTRLEFKSDGIGLAGHSESKQRNSWLQELEMHPERFSPNVLLRPLYQETVLPNVGVVLGPGELAYWLQLKDLFEHFTIPFPVLIPRNHALLISERDMQRFIRMGFGPDELFVEKDELIKRWMARYTDVEAPLDSAIESIKNSFDGLADTARMIDPTLEQMVKAEEQRAKNGIEQVRKKFVAALKRRNETVMAQIARHANLVMPDGKPQERVDNFFGHYAKVGDALIPFLLESLKPFNDQLAIIQYNEQS
jgi:bacillithiol biosynthesis cysteine-adding enzyme BshC